MSFPVGFLTYLPRVVHTPSRFGEVPTARANVALVEQGWRVDAQCPDRDVEVRGEVPAPPAPAHGEVAVRTELFQHRVRTWRCTWSWVIQNAPNRRTALHTAENVPEQRKKITWRRPAAKYRSH